MGLDDLLSYATNLYLLAGIFCFISALYLWYSCYYEPYCYFKQLAVPGPKPSPVLGNLWTLLRFKGNSLDYLDHLSKTYGPVSGVYFGKKPFLCVSDPDLLKLVLIKNFDKFQNRFGEGGFSLQVDGKYYKTLDLAESESWRNRRHMLTPAFSASKLKLMEPLFNESKDRMMVKIADLADKGELADLSDLYSKLTLEVMLSIAFGIALDIQNGKGGKIYTAVGDIFNPTESDVDLMKTQFVMLAFPLLVKALELSLYFSKFAKSSEYLISVSKEIIRKRREAKDAVKRVDILQLMIDALDGGSVQGVTEGDIIVDCITFLAAGYETTSLTLTFATYLLALHPEEQERLANEIHDYYEENPDKSMYDAAQEITYLDMVVLETLRMYPAAPLSSRECTDDCDLGSLSLKKGAYVMFSSSTIHYDPELWSEPDKFDPERFTPEEKAKRHPCAFLPFGHGPRNCIGMRFALIEIKLALIAILLKYKIVQTPETEVPVQLKFRGLLVPKNPLKVLFKAR